MLEVLRKEVKYSISLTDYYRLLPMLQAVMERDGHDHGVEGYEVRSLYFDSSCDCDLFDTLYGMSNKQKIRLRCYSADATEFKLEYKCKSLTDSRKSSISLDRNRAKELMDGNYESLAFAKEEVARELYARMISECYRPKATVVYLRHAFLDSLNDVRITYDYDVKVSRSPYALIEANAPFINVTGASCGVLEVKYNNFLPGRDCDALAMLDGMPVANSKYLLARFTL